MQASSAFTLNPETITDAGVTFTRIGVQLQDGDAGRELRKRVEGLLAGALQSSRPTHTI